MKQLGMIIGLLAGMSGAAIAQSGPSLEIWSGSQSTSVALPSQGNGTWGFTQSPSDPLTFSLNGSSISLSWVTLESDPTVSYGLGVTNNSSSTMPYTFTFVTPTVLAPGQYAVSASVSGSLTDGGSDGVTVSPPASGAIQQSFIGTAAGNDAGVDLLTSTITAPDEASSDPIPKATASSTYTLGSTASQISVTTAFNLSAGDSATFSGRFDVNAVPEPSSIGLGLICTVIFGFLAIRRRRNA
jgi:hypothetical protein